MTNLLNAVHSPDSWIRRYVDLGIWRDRTPLDDLAQWAAETPDATAVSAWREGAPVHHVTYRQYAQDVDRYARVLHARGIGDGDVVALWLPNRFEVLALLLACWKVGAITAPISPTVGRREVGRILDRLDAAVCVTSDDLATGLPALRLRLSLADFEQDAPDVRFAGVNPDQARIVLFTSGTTGEPKGAVHTLNTAITQAIDWLTTYSGTEADCTFTPHALVHIAGMTCSLFMPLLVGGRTLLMAKWDPAVAGELIVSEGVTIIGAAPAFLEQLHVRGPREIYTGGNAPSAALVRQMREEAGVTLRGVWGMTEACNIFTRPDDPADWASHSVGQPAKGLEVRLQPEIEAPVSVENPGRMHVRGSGVCVATLGRDGGALEQIADHNDGWYDTGDLAVPDGRGGFTIVGRVADRIGSGFMIPVTDVEEALCAHPLVKEAALIGVPGLDGQEIVCAVVVPADPGRQPGLDELRQFLLADGMTPWYLPERLSITESLPRNALGKVQKALLRRQQAHARG